MNVLDFQSKITIKGYPRKPNYVYAYYIKNIPRYVGLGTNGRALQHLRVCTIRGQRLKSVFYRELFRALTNGDAVELRYISSSNDRDKMSALEVDLIDDLGRHTEGGYLYNVVSGGDGGRTVPKGSRKITDGTKDRMLHPGRRMPTGWYPGSAHPRVKGEIKVWHNPKTGERCYERGGADLTKEGLVPGAPKKGQVGYVSTGPRGKQKWHNPKTGKIYWLTQEDSKRGLVPGIGRAGSTSGRTVYHDPVTLKCIWVPREQGKPRGYTPGFPASRSGSKCSFNGKSYQNVQQCMDATGLTRYKLEKSKGFKLL